MSLPELTRTSSRQRHNQAAAPLNIGRPVRDSW